MSKRFHGIEFPPNEYELYKNVTQIFSIIEEICEGHVEESSALTVFYEQLITAHMWFGTAIKHHCALTKDMQENPEKYEILREKKAKAKEWMDKAVASKKRSEVIRPHRSPMHSSRSEYQPRTTGSQRPRTVIIERK